MIARKKIQQLTFVLCFGVSLTCAASPALLLSFGPTVVLSADATLDMGHFSGAVLNTQISWNKVVAADNSSLTYSDGSTATGVAIVVGRSNAGVSNSVSFSNKLISSSALGSTIKNGIYTNSSPNKGGIFATAGTGGTSINTNVLGARIDGLAAGTYTLYISGRNSNTGATAPEQFFATNGSSASSFSFSSNTPSALEANSAANPPALPNGALAIQNTLAYGDNCTLLVVTLNAGDSIYLAASGATNIEFRGFLNAVEVVPGLPVLTNFPTAIGSQPGNVLAYEGSTITISGSAAGIPPLYFQWYSNSVPITAATNASLVLSNVTAVTSANYNFIVSNSVNAVTSSNATLTIVPFFNTAQMSNI
jgi:hypothetical protein